MKNSDSNIRKTKGGRKVGSTNKLSQEAKEYLLEVFGDDLANLNKYMAHITIDERFIALKPYAKILTTGNDEVSIETKKIIFDNLQEHFKRLKFYIAQLPAEERATELRQYLFCLDKEQIEEVFKSLK